MKLVFILALMADVPFCLAWCHLLTARNTPAIERQKDEDGMAAGWDSWQAGEIQLT